MSDERIYCPHCGSNVTSCEETECGIICPSCRNDFWKSETIPKSEISQYVHMPQYNIMMKRTE